MAIDERDTRYEEEKEEKKQKQHHLSFFNIYLFFNRYTFIVPHIGSTIFFIGKWRAIRKKAIVTRRCTITRPCGEKKNQRRRRRLKFAIERLRFSFCERKTSSHVGDGGKGTRRRVNNGRTDELTDGRTDGRTSERTNEREERKEETNERASERRTMTNGRSTMITLGERDERIRRDRETRARATQTHERGTHARDAHARDAHARDANTGKQTKRNREEREE